MNNTEVPAAKERYRLSGTTPESLESWWCSLDESRGERARLRRVDSPDDVLLTDAFFHFLERMPESWRNDRQIYGSAIVAAILAQVKTNKKEKSFAAQLATSGNGDQPVLSELRFRQLLKSRTPEEFFRRMLRAVRLLDGSVNIFSLTEGILRWYQEYLFGPERNPVNRLSVQWAQDYFLAIK